MQIMFVDFMLGMADLADVKEPTESFLKPCGGPASSKGLPLAAGRTVVQREGAI